MDAKKVLTEEEYKTIPSSVLAKLESAYRAELATAVEHEVNKSNTKFQKLLESVGTKADALIGKAVQENVERMNQNAMNDKMYGVLKSIATILESAGIPTSELTKKLKEELAICNVNLKKAYEDREHVVAQLNEQQKKNFIYSEVQGMRPEVVDAVMEHFIHYDVREITREAISKFLDGTGREAYMMDTDPDAGGELNLDNVTAVLSDVQHDLELDVPSLPSQQRAKTGKRFETLGKGLKNERVAKATPNVTFESLANINNMNLMEAAEEPEVDDDVAAAISQFKSLDKFGAFA